MAELATLARPYAKAAFEVAADANKFADWSIFLGNAATAASEGAVDTLLSDPSQSGSQLAELFIDITGSESFVPGKNFLSVLAKNKRLALLPVIAEQFEKLKAEKEQSIDVEIITALEISDDTQATLVSALSKKFNRDINISNSVDKELIGGAIIRAGDLVIDGSVRGKLEKLAEAITS